MVIYYLKMVGHEKNKDNGNYEGHRCLTCYVNRTGHSQAILVLYWLCVIDGNGVSKLCCRLTWFVETVLSVECLVNNIKWTLWCIRWNWIHSLWYLQWHEMDYLMWLACETHDYSVIWQHSINEKSLLPLFHPVFVTFVTFCHIYKGVWNFLYI